MAKNNSNPKQKQCTKCGEYKDISLFYWSKQRGTEDSWCKECKLAASRKLYRDNPEKKLAQCKEYKAKTNYNKHYYEHNKQRLKQQSRRNYWKSPNRWREYALKWQKDNPDKVAARASRRRAREHGAKGSYTAKEFAILCEVYGNCCLACGSIERLTADHIIPLVKGGSNYIDNIQPLCHSCNCSKRDKTIDYRKHKKRIRYWKQLRLF